MGRKHRIAKKIVSRFQQDPAGSLGYSLEQVFEAHRHLGTPVDPAKASLYRDAKESYLAASRARAQENATRAEARRARKAEQDPPGIEDLGDPLPEEAPTDLPAEGQDEGAPDPSVEAPEVEAPEAPEEGTIGGPLDFKGMSVKDLKAECRARKLPGYSQLKKDALVALLVEHVGTAGDPVGFQEPLTSVPAGVEPSYIPGSDGSNPTL